MTSRTPFTNTVFLRILAGILCLLFLGGFLLSYLQGRVSPNPAGTIGNTPGNLHNGGLFCESEGIVYFSNAADADSLYAMNPDESEPRKLGDMPVRNLLAGGDYLYYFQQKSQDTTGFGSVTNTHSFNRCKRNGKSAVSLTRDVIVSGQLVDNYLYLLSAGKNAPSFYKMKIDKSQTVQLADYAIDPACAYNGTIYYNGTLDDHALYSLNTSNDVSSKIWDGNLWYPVIDGDFLYYMDVENHYRLCRYSLSGQSVEILTKDRVDCFNVGNGFIYYQKNDAVSPQLICMHTDGSNAFVLADGNFTSINMTSRYVYFKEFGTDTVLYHSSLGSGSYSSFYPSSM